MSAFSVQLTADSYQLMKIYGLIGYPVKHSLSKTMQEAAFAARGINAEYRLIPVKPEELEDFLINNKKISDIDGKAVSVWDLSGFNITVPHKVSALIDNEIIHIADQHVLLAGAVNTVKVNKKEKKLNYYNTDARGFSDALRKDLNFSKKDKKILIFGCGGAGRAVIAGLFWRRGGHPARVYVYEPNKDTIRMTEEHFRRFSVIREGRPGAVRQEDGAIKLTRETVLEFINKEKIAEIIKQCDLLVNASPVGMEGGDPSPIGKDLLREGLYVYDVVYNRGTRLIKDAKKLGLPAQGGLGMLLYQGALAFKIWTGEDAPIGLMRNALTGGSKNYV